MRCLEPLENEDIFESLRSGAILCQLMNEVHLDSCPDFDPFPETPEAEADNVAMYLEACNSLGIQCMFEPDDLLLQNDTNKVIGEKISICL